MIKCLISSALHKGGFMKVRERKIRCTKVSWRLPEHPGRNNCWYRCVPLRRSSWLQTRRWAPRSSLGKCHEAKQPNPYLESTEKELSYKMQWIALVYYGSLSQHKQIHCNCYKGLYVIVISDLFFFIEDRMWKDKVSEEIYNNEK